jgi:hypothetical protein
MSVLSVAFSELIGGQIQEEDVVVFVTYHGSLSKHLKLAHVALYYPLAFYSALNHKLNHAVLLIHLQNQRIRV